MSASTHNILVIRRRYLGDIVLLVPVFRNLRLHWPQARLTALVEPSYAEVLALDPDVDAVVPLPRSGAGLGVWWRTLRALRRGRFTHVFDFDNTDKTALLARCTGAGLRATFHRESISCKHGWAYTYIARVSNQDYDQQHITETYLRLLPAAGVPVVSREFRLAPRAADLAALQKLSPFDFRPATPRLLVHPGSRSPFRLWPSERFARVIDRVQRELGTRVFLTAGPGEEPVVAEIARQCTNPPVVIDAALTIPQLGALLSLFPVLLCHDSGPMHLAAAVGARVIALYGSQNATIWRPLGAGHTMLQTPLPCTCLPDAPTPCVKQDAYRSYCVRKLTEDEVFAAVAKTLLHDRPAAGGLPP
jgi:predicted lipopolysaccharide heptosyltransferase III